MAFEASCFSPNILIYLEVAGKKIRLSDLLFDSATLFEAAEIPPQTKASLVVSIDGKEEREDVILQDGISKDAALVFFTYADPQRLNGRHFPV